MSSLTSKEVRGLMEAYQQVYAPQEIAEEQVWEEVEEWVNGLLDEGYDLSDYTWEEMYEAYIEEQGGIAPSVSRLRAGGPGRPEAPKPAPSMSYTQRMEMRRDVRNRGSSRTNRPQVSNIPPSEGTGKPGPGRLGNIPPEEGTGRGGPSDIKAKPSGGSGGGTSAARPSGNAPAPTAKPSGGSTGAPAASAGGAAPASTGKPATAASAPSKPAPGTKAAGPESIKPKTPNPLLAGGELARMRAASMMRQQGRDLPSGKVPTSADLAPKPSTPAGNPFTGANAAAARTAVAAATSPKPAATTASSSPTPTANPFKGSAATTAVNAATKKPAPIASHTDLFDLVKGYLLDEGYADTEEAALAIMSSMSEEWRESIVQNYLDEQVPIGSKNYGDTTSDKWNKGYSSYMKSHKAGREMTPPAIPTGYKYSEKAGTVVRNSPTPSQTTAKPSR